MTDTPDALFLAYEKAVVAFESAENDEQMQEAILAIAAARGALKTQIEAGDAAIKRVAELEQAIDERDGVTREIIAVSNKYEADLAAARAEIDRKDAALRFYAGHHPNANEGPWGTNSTDFGDIARAALALKETNNG